MSSWIWFIIIGIAAGFLAGLIMKGRGFGLILNLIIGIVGSVLGGWIFSFLGIGSTGLIGALICAVVGAVVLLFIISFFKRN